MMMRNNKVTPGHVVVQGFQLRLAQSCLANVLCLPLPRACALARHVIIISHAEKYRSSHYVYHRADYMLTWYVHTLWSPALHARVSPCAARAVVHTLQSPVLRTRASLSSSCGWHAMIVTLRTIMI